MKRIVSAMLILTLLGLCAGCGQADAPATTSAPAETTMVATEPALTGPAALDGKKIIFIGNSYTFWGQTVLHKDQSVLKQELRSNDQGYFYQLCKENGAQVQVTNWTFGAHDFTDLFGSECKTDKVCEGEKHFYFLQDAAFDYVAIQLYAEKEYGGDIVKHLEPAVELFREANPNVKFLLLVPHMAHEKSYEWLEDVQKLEDEGFLICDWGAMLHDISEGTVEVPGAAQQYARSSFVNSLDDHHENVLAGYITSLMTYCAITGDSAVGQSYGFCDDSTIDPLFDLEAFKEKNYPDGTTNFVEVFRSEVDMRGLQQLVDQYLAK